MVAIAPGLRSCHNSRVNDSNNMPTLANAVEQGRLTVSVDGFGFRGDGWVRLDDGWLSVPGALPGERIVVVRERNIR